MDLVGLLEQLKHSRTDSAFQVKEVLTSFYLHKIWYLATLEIWDAMEVGCQLHGTTLKQLELYLMAVSPILQEEELPHLVNHHVMTVLFIKNTKSKSLQIFKMLALYNKKYKLMVQWRQPS